MGRAELSHPNSGNSDESVGNMGEPIFNSMEDLSWADASATHSPAKIRLRNSWLTMREILISRHRINPEVATEYLDPVFYGMLACSLMYHPVRLPGGEQLKLSIESENDAYERYTKRMQSRWSRLRPILTPLKLSKGNLTPALAPPE